MQQQSDQISRSLTLGRVLDWWPIAVIGFGVILNVAFIVLLFWGLGRVVGLF